MNGLFVVLNKNIVELWLMLTYWYCMSTGSQLIQK